jgi:hypothetical protein
VIVGDLAHARSGKSRSWTDISTVSITAYNPPRERASAIPGSSSGMTKPGCVQGNEVTAAVETCRIVISLPIRGLPGGSGEVASRSRSQAVSFCGTVERELPESVDPGSVREAPSSSERRVRRILKTVLLAR